MPEYWDNCTVPWITLADVWQLRSGTINVIRETKEKISALGLANSAAVKHPSGTVILSRTASVGFSAIMGADMATSQDFATWTCGPKLDSRYLLHSLRAMTPDLKRIAMGSTHKTIYMPDIEQLRVPVPPMEEQRRIADFLDFEVRRMDRLVSLRGQQLTLSLKLLETQAAEITGRTLLHRDNDASQRNRIQLRRAISAIQTGVTPRGLRDSEAVGSPAEGMPWYTPAAIDGLLHVTHADKYVPSDDRDSAPHFPAGSVLVTGIGESLGKVGYLVDAATGNQQLTALTPAPGCDGRFLAWQLWAAKEELREWAQYSRIRIINNEVLKSLPIHLPSYEVQVSVSGKLDEQKFHFIRLKQALQEFSERLSERRQALITAAVTGQIDVSTASGRGIEE